MHAESLEQAALNLSRWLSFSNWEKNASCVLLQTDILEEWVDCRGVSTVPCLRVTVNVSGFNQEAFLHFDEESVLLATEVGIYGSRFQALRIYLISV